MVGGALRPAEKSLPSRKKSRPSPVLLRAPDRADRPRRPFGNDRTLSFDRHAPTRRPLRLPHLSARLPRDARLLAASRGDPAAGAPRSAARPSRPAADEGHSRQRPRRRAGAGLARPGSLRPHARGALSAGDRPCRPLLGPDPRPSHGTFAVI